MRRVGIALIAALVVAGCGSGSPDEPGDALNSGAASPTTSDASGTSTSQATTRETRTRGTRWCASWHAATSLIEGPDPDPALFQDALSALRRDAPSELRGPVEELVRSYEGAVASDDSPTPSAQSHAALVDWGNEQCGDPLPLCSLWPSYTALISLSAFAPEDEMTPTLEEYAAVTLARFPPELDESRQAIEAFGPAGPAEAERAAEAAFDEVDAWVERSCNP